jgi:hypothetical protein
MSSLKRTMTFAAYEPGAQGPWPKEKYEELYSIQAQILNAMATRADVVQPPSAKQQHDAPSICEDSLWLFSPILPWNIQYSFIPSSTAVHTVCGISLTHGSRLLTASPSLICSKPLSITASHLRRSYPSLSGWRIIAHAGDGCPSKETAKRARRSARPSQQDTKRRQFRTKMALRLDCWKKRTGCSPGWGTCSRVKPSR